MADLFREFWWLGLVLFGMAITVMNAVHAGQRVRGARELVQAYVAQGKEPPAEIVRLAAGN